MDLSLGAVFSADVGEVHPTARLRLRLPLPPASHRAPDLILRALPLPEAVLKMSLPVLSTGLRLGAALSLPFGLEEFDAVMVGSPIQWQPRFRCKLSTGGEAGPLSFSPRGIEFTEQSLSIGRDTVLRVAALVDLPRAWPPETKDAFPLTLRLDKLALKSRIRYG